MLSLALVKPVKAQKQVGSFLLKSSRPLETVAHSAVSLSSLTPSKQSEERGKIFGGGSQALELVLKKIGGTCAGNQAIGGKVKVVFGCSRSLFGAMKHNFVVFTLVL